MTDLNLIDRKTKVIGKTRCGWCVGAVAHGEDFVLGFECCAGETERARCLLEPSHHGRVGAQQRPITPSALERLRSVCLSLSQQPRVGSGEGASSRREAPGSDDDVICVSTETRSQTGKSLRYRATRRHPTTRAAVVGGSGDGRRFDSAEGFQPIRPEAAKNKGAV